MSHTDDRAPAALSHINAAGQAHMVDVSTKAETRRTATATGVIRMTQDAFSAIRDNALRKGDVLGVARIAAIMAAKHTADLIPLCHPVVLSHIDVVLTPDESLPGVRAEATATATGATGVEMEAIVAVTIALTTVYDMAKSADRTMVIGDIRLLRKSGGRSGDYTVPV